MRGTAIVLLAAAFLSPTALVAEPVNPVPDVVDLSQYRGKVVLLDFWASWCGPCRASFPWMAELQARHGEQDLVVIAVNLDEDRAAATSFLEAVESGFEIAYDPEGRMAEAFELPTMPSSVLIDRSGSVVYRHAGFRDGDRQAYERRIQGVLDGKSIQGESRWAGNTRGAVKPWERDVLAHRDMALDCDPLDLAFDDHVYFSKEASSGGRGFGGGGCGCN